VRNHARSALACDFVVAVTATFRVVCVFVVLEIATRRLVHWHTTERPTADWTAQPFRTIISGDQPHQYVIHDRDSIFSEGVDRTLAAMGLTVLRTPAQAPQANAFCERLLGTIRRECLDFLIPPTERHLREILRRWVTHYNRLRPPTSLGLGLPDPPPDPVVASNGHHLPDGRRVVATPILGGLPHEYRLEAAA
jgi:putative transposase